MQFEEQLLAAELEGWQALTTPAGGDYYRQNLTEGALMAFASGVLSRAEAIAALEQAPPWASFDISDASVVQLSADSGVLVYRVRARRADAEPYEAVVSSTFVRVDGTWRLAFHQQTPAAA